MRRIRTASMLLAMAMIAAALAACGQGSPSLPPATTAAPTAVETPTPTPEPTPTPSPTPTLRPILTITSVFPGEEPEGLAAVFEKLNERLGAEIYGRLELSWAPEKEYDGAVAAAAAAGSIDFAWIDSAALPEYVEKQFVAPLDELMVTYGQPILDNTNPALLETMKYGGRLMGIPSAGNMPLCNTGSVLVFREDLRQKYDLPQLNSVARVEQYLKTIKEKEPKLTPVAANNAVLTLMKAYGPEELLPGAGNAVAYKVNDDGTVTCINLQDAEGFKGAAARVRVWYRNGWLPKDMPAVKDGTVLLKGGTAAAAAGKAMSSTALQQATLDKAPDAVLMEAPLFGKAKYLTGDGGSALCLTASGNNLETVVQFWAWVLSSQDNYDLFCYGVEHVNFELNDGRIAVLDDGYASFPDRVFDNVNYRRFPAGVSDEYIETLRKWNDGAAVSPLIGFVFNPAKVKNEMAKVKAVYASYGPAINAGSADTKLLLAEFAAKMKAAGQNKIVAEAQAQVEAYLGKRS